MHQLAGLFSAEIWQEFIENLPQTFVVIDEAYIEFSNQQSAINLLMQYPNLVVIRTLSKFFCLAGVRLGFIFTQYKNDIMKVKSPYNVNQRTCHIGINVFQNLTQEIIKSRYNKNLINRQATIDWVKQFPGVVTIYPSFTNVLFIKLNCNSQLFAQKLLTDFNMKIKGFSGAFENFSRISY